MIFKMFGNIENFRRIIKATNVLLIRLIATNHRKTLRFNRRIKNMGFKRYKKYGILYWQINKNVL